MNHVPYKGAAPAVADLLGGRIQVWIGAANTLLPHIKEGKLRLPRRHADHREKRTRLRARSLARPVRSGENARGGRGRIHADVVKAVNAPELKSKLASQGIMIETNSPAEFARAIREDNARWGKVIKEAGIKGE